MTKSEQELLSGLYHAFNRRDIEAVLGVLTPDVAWANAMDGGHEHGRDAVRSYWTRQFDLISSTVTPLSMTRTEDARVLVRVHQVVRSADSGDLLADKEVGHLFSFEGEIVSRFDIAPE